MEMRPVVWVNVRFSLFLFSGIPVINRILLGICAMDYLGDDLYPSSDTPGLIVDDVSCLEQQHVCLPIGSLDSVGHA